MNMIVTDNANSTAFESPTEFTLGQDALIYNLRKNWHSWRFIAKQFYHQYKLEVDERTVSSRYEIVKGRTLHIKLNKGGSQAQLRSYKGGFGNNGGIQSKALPYNKHNSLHGFSRMSHHPALKHRRPHARHPRLVLYVSGNNSNDSDSCAVESD